jgi:surfeit locus 1 family protein
MLVRQHHVRTGWLPTLVVLLMVPLLVSLGFWQLKRAEEKRAIQSEYDARSRDARVEIEQSLQHAEDLRFYRVIARGKYDPQYQILIDNRVQDGRVGYHVITPLRVGDSNTRVLVNRGWVALGPTREVLPTADAPAGVQEITGVATVPREKVFSLAEAAPLSGNWQTVWQHIDMRRYAEAAPFPVQPVVILLDADSPAGGLVRDWARLDAGIAVHKGYAFQWFTLAAALLAIYLFFNFRSTGKPQDDGENVRE